MIWILHAVSFIILTITAVQDIRNQNNVSSYLFPIIPLTMILISIISKEQINFINHILGFSLSLIFLIFALFGKCGGADVIMAACLGIAYGFKDMSILVIAACITYLIYLIIYNVSKKRVKKSNQTALPFLPAALCGFVIMVVCNYIFIK